MISVMAALLLVTGVGLGHARGLMPADSAVVICRGHITTVIWIDADGQEVEQDVLCPDAAPGFLADTAAAVPGDLPLVLGLWSPRFDYRHASDLPASFGPPVRGPPLAV